MSGSITMSSFGENGAPLDRGRIRWAVQQLPPVEREALLLHWLHGLKYGEIAQELRLPVSGVQALIANARAAMRSMVGSPRLVVAY
jgi:DNA-directed RNA polymerase specialized sigma24 family protein